MSFSVSNISSKQRSEAGELARDLFDSEAGQGSRVLLLSATPYRGLSLHHETDDDHYGDFLALLRFLENGDAAGCKEILAEYRAALPAVMTPDGLTRLRTSENGAPAASVPGNGAHGTPRIFEQCVAECFWMRRQPTPRSMPSMSAHFWARSALPTQWSKGDVVEYWKSAPYLFNFMDNYALKQAFKDAPEKDQMVGFVREFPETFLDLERARAYQPLEPANPRLRELLSETVDRGMWRLLWMPPSLGYYASGWAVCRSGIGRRDKAAGLFRLAHGSARRRVARFLRSRAPDDAGVPSARAIDARGLEKAAGIVAVWDIGRASYGSALALACLSMSYVCPRLRPARVGAGRPSDRGRGALAVRRSHKWLD